MRGRLIAILSLVFFLPIGVLAWSSVSPLQNATNFSTVFSGIDTTSGGTGELIRFYVAGGSGEPADTATPLASPCYIYGNEIGMSGAAGAGGFWATTGFSNVSGCSSTAIAGEWWFNNGTYPWSSSDPTNTCFFVGSGTNTCPGAVTPPATEDFASTTAFLYAVAPDFDNMTGYKLSDVLYMTKELTFTLLGVFLALLEAWWPILLGATVIVVGIYKLVSIPLHGHQKILKRK